MGRTRLPRPPLSRSLIPSIGSDRLDKEKQTRVPFCLQLTDDGPIRTHRRLSYVGCHKDRRAVFARAAHRRRLYAHILAIIMVDSNRPQPLGDVLEEVIEQLGLQDKMDEARVIETWAAVAGPDVNGVTDSVWMDGATLYVKITSATWRQELHMNRRQWRTRLNEELDAELVDEIVFR